MSEETGAQMFSSVQIVQGTMPQEMMLQEVTSAGTFRRVCRVLRAMKMVMTGELVTTEAGVLGR